MGKGLFEVSHEQLELLLHLPEDTTILFLGAKEPYSGTFEVMVEHPDLPKGLVDCEPVWKIARTELISWGYEGEGK